jgi:hypothetical protein
MTREEQLKIADLLFLGDLEIIVTRQFTPQGEEGSWVSCKAYDRLLGKFYLIEYVQQSSTPIRTVRRDSIRVSVIEVSRIDSPTVFI